MRKVTEYGYFGRTQNVRDTNIDVGAFAALIVALPPRRKAMTDPEGRPLRLIALADLPTSQGDAHG
ncbi:hypothetical protein DBR17_17915 [Sphingomonas sp. HMWF008]|nr:hypothetical protein DBR17_17915 [Sphingomonas sp. HMWF008]